MKLIYNLSKIFLLAVFVMIANSCEEQWDLKDGGKLGAIMYPEADIAFLFQVTDQVTVNLNTSANQGITITAVNVTKQLFTSAGDSDPVVIDVAGDQFTQSKSELFADVPVGGQTLSEDDLTAGDYWTLSYTMSLADGRVMNIGRETTITFSCPSSIAGTYDAESTGEAGGGWGTYPGNASFPWDGTGEVTLAASAVEGVYEISEITGEFYNLFWGGSPENGTFRDVCGNYTIDSKTDQWGDTLTTTVTNNGDGSITIVWENTYGDSGTTILTPQ